MKDKCSTQTHSLVVADCERGQSDVECRECGECKSGFYNVKHGSSTVRRLRSLQYGSTRVTDSPDAALYADRTYSGSL